MKGHIFTYDENGSIFFINDIGYRQKIVFIDGLGGNILSNAYISRLNEFCISHQISLVIPQLRSMPNFKITPIEYDIDDINNVINKLEGEIVLMGFSTGCNDILLYLQKYQNHKIKGVILQAPVSDTESVNYEMVDKNLSLIYESPVQNLYIELPKIGLWRKERYISLYKKYEKEDLFSSYLKDEIFSKWSDKVKILSILSGSDEYVTTDMRDKFSLMGKVCVIQNANHALSNIEHQNILLREIEKFLQEIF